MLTDFNNEVSDFILVFIGKAFLVLNLVEFLCIILPDYTHCPLNIFSGNVSHFLSGN